MTSKGIRALFKDLGRAPRMYTTDYIDAEGICKNVDSFIVVPPESEEDVDKLAIRGILADSAAKGFTVYSIYEILNGYSNEQLEQMPRAEALKHVRRLYLDIDAMI